jgi:transposase
VPLPSGEEEAFRSDISLKEYLKKERNGAINRLHALYGNAGIIDVTKKDMKDAEGQADLLEEQLALFERQLVAERVRSNGLAPYVMSIPGIGIEIAAALLAYFGDGSRFSGSAQVACYAGLTPRVDCSGLTERYGSIAKSPFCHPIRGVGRGVGAGEER